MIMRPGDKWCDVCIVTDAAGALVAFDAAPTITVYKSTAAAAQFTNDTGSWTVAANAIKTGVYEIYGTIPAGYTNREKFRALVEGEVDGTPVQVLMPAVDVYTKDNEDIYLDINNTINNLESGLGYLVAGLEGEMAETVKYFANKKTKNVATGVVTIFDDDGSTPLVTLTPSEEDGVITVTPG